MRNRTKKYKKIELAFEIGLPVNKHNFQKLTKNDVMLVNISDVSKYNENRHRQNRCIL